MDVGEAGIASKAIGTSPERRNYTLVVRKSYAFLLSTQNVNIICKSLVNLPKSSVVFMCFVKQPVG